MGSSILHSTLLLSFALHNAVWIYPKMGGCVAVAKQASLEDVMVGSSGSSRTISNSYASSKLTQNIVKINYCCNVHEIYSVEEGNVLGSGKNGNVLSCTHKITKRRYALKWLNKSEVSAKDLEHIRDELQCLAYLDHPNILRDQEVFESEEDFCLILELCTGGNLLNRLRTKFTGYFQERDACKYIHSILSAIAYCHGHNVVHRDLKLENVVFEDDSIDSELKVIG